MLQQLLFAALAVSADVASIDAAGARLAAGQSVADSGLTSAAGALAAYALISLAAALVALSIAQGALSHFADRRLAGEPTTLSTSLRHALRRLPAVAGTSLLLSALIVALEMGIVLAAVVLTFVAGFAGLAPVGTGLGALALIVAPLFLFARVSTAPQVAALEGVGPVGALVQAYRDLSGRYGSSVTVVFVTGVIGWVGAFLLQATIGAVLGGSRGGWAAAALATTVAAVLLGPLPQVALTALHRSAAGR